MVTKSEVGEKFQKNWKKYYEVPLFKEKGFERRQCSKCGKFYWSADPERTTCGDPPCDQYTFIGEKKKDWDYLKTWRKIEEFFVSRGHKSVKRYPVVCRWIPNLDFTIASIVDFQRIESDKVVFEYPNKKLIVPQLCLRFNDIANVGVTGRHLTGFMMPGQHAFGDYWIDECLHLSYDFLTQVLEIEPKKITYIEGVWAMPDMSVYGPCVETMVDGLEVTTNVFMQFTLDADGKEQELPLKVIDVGWGLERLCWYMNGTPTAYETAFGDVMGKLFDKTGVQYDREFFDGYAKVAGALDIDVGDLSQKRDEVAKQLGVTKQELMEKIEPVQALYAVADHARALLFAISDGMLPSNAGGGHNLRVIARRAFGFIDQYKWNVDLGEIAEMHAKYLEPLFPEFMKTITDTRDIIANEEMKYRETMKRAKAIVEKELENPEDLTIEKMLTLYDSDGITPELVHEIAKGMKVEVNLPEDFYGRLTELHKPARQKKEKHVFDVTNFPKTEKLYYSDGVYDFKAYVLECFDLGDRQYIVLDKTAFYPESGGQDYDLGYIDRFKVKDVQKIEDVILHETEGKFVKGTLVHGRVDEKRRKQLMRHHTGTHIINGSCQKVLGKHIWQAGSEKKIDKARLDITHYEIPSQTQLDEIEKTANEEISRDIPVNTHVLPREEAEEKFSFRIYQGGAVPSKKLRIVEIPGFDVEACGGTHCTSTGQVERIKILRAKKIQDGVIRIEFVAGNEAIKDYEELSDTEEDEKTATLMKKILEMNSNLRLGDKSLRELDGIYREEFKKIRKESISKASEYKLEDNVEFIGHADMKMLQEIGRKRIKEDSKAGVVLISTGMVYAVRGTECPHNIKAMAEKAASILGGKIGETKIYDHMEWKGGGPDKGKSEEAYQAVKKMMEAIENS
ncbi:MAG: alanine--tRNA ligase [Candidatus Micrarchaeota archaeon]